MFLQKSVFPKRAVENIAAARLQHRAGSNEYPLNLVERHSSARRSQSCVVRVEALDMQLWNPRTAIGTLATANAAFNDFPKFRSPDSLPARRA